MLQQVATKLLVDQTKSAFYTQAIDLSDANALEVTAEVETFAITITGAQYSIDVGNDLQNWSDSGASPVTLDKVGYFSITATAVAARFARVKFAVTAGTGAMVVAAQAETSRQ